MADGDVMGHARGDGRLLGMGCGPWRALARRGHAVDTRKGVPTVKRMTRRPTRLTHLDARGAARMVDVSGKPATTRTAVARGRVYMHRDTLAVLAGGAAAKGDALAVARLAGIQAAKRTGELIPLAHTLALSGVELDFTLDEESASVGIEARARAVGPTGVEMEALTAVSVAALTVYDMLKAVDRGMVIGEITLWEKRGGRRGTYRRGR